MWAHVKAHSGNPWNEAVDTLAKAICMGQIQTPHCEDLWNEVAQGDQSWTWSWFWFFEQVRWSTDEALQFCNTDLLMRLPPIGINHAQSLRICDFDKICPDRDIGQDIDGSFAKLRVASITTSYHSSQALMIRLEQATTFLLEWKRSPGSAARKPLMSLDYKKHAIELTTTSRLRSTMYYLELRQQDVLEGRSVGLPRMHLGSK